MGALNFYIGQNLKSDYYRSLEPCQFVDFSRRFIYEKIRTRLQVTYFNAITHFEEYQSESERVFMSNEISREEIFEFADYLELEKGLKMSTIQGIVSRIKYLLSKAERCGWSVDESYEDTRISTNETNAIYLTQKDIARIYYAKGLTRKQEEIRDLFVLGCATGQRYSDYSRLTIGNIRNGFIHVLQKKTKNKAVVPVTEYVQEIFIKYNGCLPKPRCIQYFNKALKVICRKIGFTDPVTFEEVRAGEIVKVTKQRWELISSHTARRSFVTNMIQQNANEQSIMGCTGHKSSTCFARYNRQTLEENARALAGNGYLR